MQDSYKKILIPVDFSINTEVAVKKTLELIDSDEASIYLLHIHKYRLSLSKASGFSKEGGLEHWKTSIKERQPSVLVHTEVIRSNSVQKEIAKKAAEWQTDLIVIGQRSNHSWFPFLNTVMPVELAEDSGCAVLTVKPGALHNRIRTVVVPVTDHVTLYKMQAIAALCKRFKLKIHLVTFMDGKRLPDVDSTSSVLKIYQWLKESVRCPVEYVVLKGYNKAKALLHYSEKIDADILLVNAATETKMGRLNIHISDVLPAASRMQVLTLQTEN